MFTRHLIKNLVLLFVIFPVGILVADNTEPAATANKESAAPAEHAAPSSITFAAEPLDLAACLSLAMQHQPRIAAARASLASAVAGKQALDDLNITATLVDHEIPVRRRQACLGITAATAAVDQSERETAYAVTRTYFTVLFAREQERVARGVVDNLSAVDEVVRGALQSGARNISSTDANRTKVYLRLAQTQQYKAAQGVKRALVALREAMGMCPEFHFDVASGPLPEPKVHVNQDEVIACALARRGELVQASIFAEETCLEIEAQGTSIHKRMETFAAGADIHSQLVPQGVHNDEYRPGAIAPEMPTMLAGSRSDRVDHARALHTRAHATVEVTRNLIALEAEDAYLRWEEAVNEAGAAKEAADTGKQLADDLSKDFTSGLKARVEDVVNARVLASQARSRYNEYIYHQILALADLERITAGGFCAGLAELISVRVQSNFATNEAK